MCLGSICEIPQLQYYLQIFPESDFLKLWDNLRFILAVA